MSFRCVGVGCRPRKGRPRFRPDLYASERKAREKNFPATAPHIHHDALEFPDGEIVLLTRLCEGQKATPGRVSFCISGCIWVTGGYTDR
jgi:hypothetical protein